MRKFVKRKEDIMKRLLAIIILLSMIMGMLISCNIFDPTGSSTSSSTSGSTSSNSGSTTTPGSSTTSSTSSTTTDKGEEPPVKGAVEVVNIGYSFETVFFEWLPYESATEYNVYCDGKRVDSELIRYYGSYYRCDVLGITAGEHEIELVPVRDGVEMESAVTSFKETAIAHVREGFGFVGGSASGAYNDDGTLKTGAQVIYVTADNAKTVTATVNGATQTGLQTILDAKQKANTSNDILCIRIIFQAPLREFRSRAEAHTPI